MPRLPQLPVTDMAVIVPPGADFGRVGAAVNRLASTTANIAVEMQQRADVITAGKYQSGLNQALTDGLAEDLAGGSTDYVAKRQDRIDTFDTQFMAENEGISGPLMDEIGTMRRRAQERERGEATRKQIALNAAEMRAGYEGNVESLMATYPLESDPAARNEIRESVMVQARALAPTLRGGQAEAEALGVDAINRLDQHDFDKALTEAGPDVAEDLLKANEWPTFTPGQHSSANKAIQSARDEERRKREAEQRVVRSEARSMATRWARDFVEGWDTEGTSYADAMNAARVSQDQEAMAAVKFAAKYQHDMAKFQSSGLENMLRVVTTADTSRGAMTREEGAVHAARVKAVRGLTTALSKGNGIVYATQQGIIDPLPEPDWNNPDEALEEQRRLNAETAGKAFTGPGAQKVIVSPLSAAATAAMVQNIEARTPEGKTVFFQTLEQRYGEEQLNAIAATVDKKDGGALAVSMGLANDNAVVSANILHGRDILADSTKAKLVMPVGGPLKEMDQAIDGALREPYLHSNEAYRATTDAVKKLYAQKQWNADPDATGEYSEALLTDAIEEVTGGILEYVGPGGPEGAAGLVSALTGAVSPLVGAGLGFARSEAVGTETSARIQAPWYGVDIDEFTEMLRGADFSDAATSTKEEILAQAKPESLGDGRYRWMIGTDYVENESGGPFVLDLVEQYKGGEN